MRIGRRRTRIIGVIAGVKRIHSFLLTAVMVVGASDTILYNLCKVLASQRPSECQHYKSNVAFESASG